MLSPAITDSLLALLHVPGDSGTSRLTVLDIGSGDGGLLTAVRAYYAGHAASHPAEEDASWRQTASNLQGRSSEQSGSSMASASPELFGIDPSYESSGLPGPFEGITFLPGRAEMLPFPDHFADIVFLQCTFSLCDPKKTVSELCRVLKDGGRVILSDLYAKEACAAESSPLLGRIDPKERIEGYFAEDFLLQSFADVTSALTSLLIQAKWDGRINELVSCEDLTMLRSVKARYGIWCWKKEDIFRDDQTRPHADHFSAREIIPSVLPKKDLLKTINKQLSYAREHSRFYSYLPTAPLRSLSEFQEIPTMDSADLTTHGADLLCCAAGEIQRMVSLRSSGTTKEPKRIAFSAEDLEDTVEFFDHGMHLLCGKGNPVGIFLPGASPDGLCDLLSRGLARFGAVPHVYGAIQDYDHAAAFCRQHRLSFLVGFPVQIRRLALLHPDLSPKGVLLSADYLAQSVKETIARVWRCEVYNHYGMTETGLGGAVETPARRGMIPRSDLYLETLPDGEIAITTLHRTAMPLIRYRTGDLGKMTSNGTLGSVFGRKVDLANSVNMPLLDELLLSDDRVLDYAAALSEDGTLSVAVLLRAIASVTVSGGKSAPVSPEPGYAMQCETASAEPDHALQWETVLAEPDHALQWETAGDETNYIGSKILPQLRSRFPGREIRCKAVTEIPFTGKRVLRSDALL